MKVCFRCGARFEGREWRCPQCDAQPTIVDGFPSFVTDTASGFDASFFDALVAVEQRNFWFAARTRLILDALRRFAPSAKTFIDIGCGTGTVLEGLRANTSLQLTGAEPFPEGLRWARKRAPDTELIHSDVHSLPYDHAFDVAGAFDVLEHIENDVDALHAIARVLKPDGILIITAPQHRWLWSAADEIAHHCRRYRRDELTGKLERTGFRVRFVTSFVSLLLPAIAVSRWSRRREARAEVELHPSINALLTGVMRAERAMINLGIRFPAGGSLLVVASKA